MGPFVGAGVEKRSNDWVGVGVALALVELPFVELVVFVVTFVVTFTEGATVSGTA